MRRVRGGYGRAALALTLALAALALAGCETLKERLYPRPAPPPAAPSAPVVAQPAAPPPAVAAQPQRASCVPRNLAKPPKYPDSDAALREAGGAADRYQLMAAGRLLRIQRLAELERILEGCR